jgi:hypothetical protein
MNALIYAMALASPTPSQVAVVLTPTELIDAIAREKGRSVTVEGYFTYLTDTRALWENEDAYLDAQDERKGDNVDYWAKCITIYPRSGAARALTGHRVRVTGKATIIEKNDVRSFWTCNQVAVEDAVITAK